LKSNPTFLGRDDRSENLRYFTSEATCPENTFLNFYRVITDGTFGWDKKWTAQHLVCCPRKNSASACDGEISLADTWKTQKFGMTTKDLALTEVNIQFHTCSSISFSSFLI